MSERNVEVVAKKVYICYMQLRDMLIQLEKRLDIGLKQKSGHYWGASASYAKGFNSILKIVKECFVMDKDFLESTNDIEEVEECLSPSVFENILSRGSKLRGTLESFISIYMAPKEKERIGFKPPSATD